MARPRIAVVGSSNTDLVVEASALPAPGETVLGKDLLTAAGGKGANQAVAAARLGAAVTLVARLGRDTFGDRALAGFAAEGIATDCVVRDPDRPSGAALIIVDGEGENLIAVGQGANGALSEDDVEAARAAIEGADLLLLQLEVPRAAVRHAARLARRAGVEVVLDPAPAAELDAEMLELVTYLTPNETEARILTDLEVVDAASGHRAAEILLLRGAANVLLTLGAGGCLVANAEGSRVIPGRTVEAVDTTAAGDTFNGALACALAAGRPLERAVEVASAAAALSVTRRGAQPSMPTREELERFLASG